MSGKKTSSKAKPPELLCVEILDAKPNKMFTPQQTAMIRFLRFSRHVPCPACGKKSRILWTMLCEFKAGDMRSSSFTLQYYPQTFAPLTAVCGDHPLYPAWPEKEKKQKAAPETAAP